MRILYLTHVCISVFMLISHNPLYSAEHKEEKKEATTEEKIGYDHVGKYVAHRTKGYWELRTLQRAIQEYPEPIRYNALKAALRSPHNDAIQFYAQKLNLWPLYIEALQAGEIDNVQALLPLMATQYTIPEYHNQETKYAELPIDDCSGLVKVIESKSLYDEQKIQLMDIIINFYQPKKYRCDSTCCVHCSFACNRRRAAFVVYGLAKAGECCIESYSSYKLFDYIYGTRKALVTSHALAVLKTQSKFLAAEELAKKKRSKRVSVLTQFDCIQLPGEDVSNGYYNQIALPVITNIQSGSWWLGAQLCSKE